MGNLQYQPVADSSSTSVTSTSQWVLLVSTIPLPLAVVLMVGALLLLLPLLRAEGGHVYPNDGAAYFRARFRLVVFRPFVGEVLVGTLTACTK